MTPEEELQHYRDVVHFLRMEYAACDTNTTDYRAGYRDGLHWAITQLTGKHPQTGETMKATFIRDDIDPDAQGRQALWKTPQGYILTSHSHPSIVTETAVFTADENGDILDWDAIHIHQGTHDHDAALHDLGYATERSKQ